MTSTYHKIIDSNNKPSGDIYKHKYWTFPTVKKPVTRGSVSNTAEWSIIVVYMKNDVIQDIKPECFDNNFLQNPIYTASYYTISGDTGKTMTESKKTVITTGKNIGKKNQTNVFTQALMEARSKYLKKLNEARILYSPMLVSKYKPSDVHFDKSIYYCQKKMDGLRCVYNNGDLWSRAKKVFPQKPYLVDELNEIFKHEFNVLGDVIDQSDIYLDGELYKHGYNLEMINSIARSSSDSNDMLEYHVFDLFIPKLNLCFNERLSLLNTILQSKDDLKYIKLVETHKLNNDNDIQYYFNYYNVQNYEGIIIRSGDNRYSLRGERSRTVMKLKERNDEDMAIVSYTVGKNGKDKDSIIFIVDANIKEYKEKAPHDEFGKMISGVTFHVVPNWPLEKRKLLYNAFIDDPQLFADKYYGAPIRIQYSTYSKKNNIPLQAKAISVLID